MPDGYRRGGSYTRNGRTYQRRGTQIRRPSRKAALIGFGALAVGSSLVGGTALVAHPIILTGAVVGAVAVICAPSAVRSARRAGLRWGKRKARGMRRSGYRHIQRRWRSHQNKQQVIRRAPQMKPKPQKVSFEPDNASERPVAYQRQPELWGPSRHGGGGLLS